IQRLVGTGYSCDALKVPGQCKNKTCGICACELGVADDGGEGTWSRSGTTLNLTTPPLRGSLAYCVKGNILELREKDGMFFRLERVEMIGAPVPCADRDAA